MEEEKRARGLRRHAMTHGGSRASESREHGENKYRGHCKPNRRPSFESPATGNQKERKDRKQEPIRLPDPKQDHSQIGARKQHRRKRKRANAVRDSQPE